jgi:DNA-binding protein Fis
MKNAVRILILAGLLTQVQRVAGQPAERVQAAIEVLRSRNLLPSLIEQGEPPSHQQPASLGWLLIAASELAKRGGGTGGGGTTVVNAADPKLAKQVNELDGQMENLRKYVYEGLSDSLLRVISQETQKTQSGAASQLGRLENSLRLASDDIGGLDRRLAQVEEKTAGEVPAGFTKVRAVAGIAVVVVSALLFALGGR